MTVIHEPHEQQPSNGAPPSDATRAARVRRQLSLALVASACLVFALTLLLSANASTAKNTPDDNGASEGADFAAEPQTDFSKFTHTNPQHARLPCLLCHKREEMMSQQRKLRFLKVPPSAGQAFRLAADTSHGSGQALLSESGFADEPHVGEVRAPTRPCSGAQLAAL